MRELLYCWDCSQFMVLVPKKRGNGFLRQPLGHHWDQGLDRISTAAGCDIYGLNGSLDFEVPGALYNGPNEGRAGFVEMIVPMLVAHYGWAAREIGPSEFRRIIDAERAIAQGLE